MTRLVYRPWARSGSLPTCRLPGGACRRGRIGLARPSPHARRRAAGAEPNSRETAGRRSGRASRPAVCRSESTSSEQPVRAAHRTDQAGLPPAERPPSDDFPLSRHDQGEEAFASQPGPGNAFLTSPSESRARRGPTRRGHPRTCWSRGGVRRARNPHRPLVRRRGYSPRSAIGSRPFRARSCARRWPPTASHSPFGLKASVIGVLLLDVHFHPGGGRGLLQHAQGEAPRLIRVGQFQALDGIREGGRGIRSCSV